MPLRSCTGQATVVLQATIFLAKMCISRKEGMVSHFRISLEFDFDPGPPSLVVGVDAEPSSVARWLSSSYVKIHFNVHL